MAVEIEVFEDRRFVTCPERNCLKRTSSLLAKQLDRRVTLSAAPIILAIRLFGYQIVLGRESRNPNVL